MTSVSVEARPQAASWKRFAWPAIIVVLLLGHVILVSAALMLSSALIPGATVAPSGYAEALAWDDEQALRRASERLGWTLEVTPSDELSPLGEREVAFVLRDRNGALLEGAELRATLYHHSQPGQTIEAAVPPVDGEPGLYAAPMRLRREGLWRLSASVRLGEESLLVENDFWLTQTGGAL